MSFVDSLLRKRAEKTLPKAIESHDLKKVSECLARGARQIDYLRWRDGDRPGERVPVAKYSCPVALAKDVGLPKVGMDMLAAHGLGPAQQSAPARPAR